MTIANFVGLRTRVYAAVRDSLKEFVTEDQVDQWIQDAIDDICRRLRIRQEETTGTTSGATITLPSDHVDTIWLHIDSDQSYDPYVQWVDNDVWNYHQANETTNVYLGRVHDNAVELTPTPTDGLDYTLRYVQEGPEAAVTDLENVHLKKIVLYAQAEAKYKEGESAAGDKYMARYEQGLPPVDLTSSNRVPGPMTLHMPGGYFDGDEYLNP